MFSRMDRIVINLVVAVLAFVGITGAISPWLEALYGEIVIGVLIIAAFIASIKYLLKSVADWVALEREARLSWKQNGAAARQLAEKHAAHPEVAEALAARMLEEKRHQQLHVVPPPSGP